MGLVNLVNNSGEIIDAVVKVSVSSDKTNAHIFVEPPVNGGVKVTNLKIKDALNKAGVVFGVSEEIIDGFLEDPVYRTNVSVARSQKPIAGDDERIEYHFTVTKDKKPKILPDGTADFKQLGFITNVRKYDLLCSKIPATDGIDGTNVLGEKIPAPKGKIVPFKAGANTVVSRDGMQLCAAIDGQVDRVGDRVEVNDTLEISGNVDFSTGNINYLGNVVVRGNVLTGFEVSAEGSVTVIGCVEGGKVTANGNVVIEQGFSGMNVGRIMTYGDLTCKYIHNGTVNAEINLLTGMCINSSVNVGGTCKVVGPNSAILSSNVAARHKIECVDVGSPTVARGSVLETGSDPHTIKRFKIIPKEQEEIQKKIKDIERVLFLYKQLEAAGRLTDEKRQDAERLQAENSVLKEKQIALIFERREIEQKLLTSGYGTVKITGKAYPGTEIVIGQSKLTIETVSKNVLLQRVDGEIVSKPVQM